MTDDNHTWIDLSDLDMERIVRTARDTDAIAGEQFTRFAQPEEREQVSKIRGPPHLPARVANDTS